MLLMSFAAVNSDIKPFKGHVQLFSPSSADSYSAHSRKLRLDET